MKTLKFLFYSLLLLLTISSCQKEKHYTEEHTVTRNEFRNPNPDSLPVQIEPSVDQVNVLWSYLYANWDSTMAKYAADTFGHMAWEESHLWNGSPGDDDFVISIPFIHQEVVTAVIIMEHFNGVSTFHFINHDWLLGKLYTDLVAEAGYERVSLWASMIYFHQYIYNQGFSTSTMIIQYLEDSISYNSPRDICWKMYLMPIFQPVAEDSDKEYGKGVFWPNGRPPTGEIGILVNGVFMAISDFFENLFNGGKNRDTYTEGGFEVYFFQVPCDDGESGSGNPLFNMTETWNNQHIDPSGGGGNPPPSNNTNFFDVPDSCEWKFDITFHKNLIDQLSSYEFVCENGTDAEIMSQLMQQLCEQTEGLQKVSLQDAISAIDAKQQQCEDVICTNKIEDFLSNNDITFTCSSMSPEEKLNELKEGNCPGPEDQEYGAYLLSLLEDDWIIDGLTDPRLKCIYESFVINDNALYCNTFENFLGDTKINLYLQNSNQVVAVAETQYYGSETHYPYTMDIHFNQNQLEGMCEVVVAGVFIHEGIHAEMFRQLHDPTIDPDDISEIWDRWDNEINHHNNMAESYINNIVNALESMFGSRYTDAQYEAIAWHGLGDVDPGQDVNTSAWNDLTPGKQQELRDLFSGINENCDDDECTN